CHQSGIPAVNHCSFSYTESPKETAFIETLEENGISLKEVDEINQVYIPGIDYDEHAEK
ncbi:MAG: hypothetical protein MHPSP_002320, partial [Paramarteilia canceri]